MSELLKTRQVCLWVMGLGIALLGHAAWAVKMDSLYQAKLLVASQSLEARNQVLEQALGQVLIKVSGSNQTINLPEIKAHLNAADKLVQEFSYSPSSLPKPYWLQMNFDPEGVNKLLRDAGVPIWGQDRPLVLIWLVNQTQDHSAVIVTEDSANVLLTLLKQDMERRGLSVIFPMMDVADMNQVSVNDIQKMNLVSLTHAAQRYASDAILIGTISQDKNNVNTQWKLMMGQDQWGWNITGKAVPDIFDAIADNMADTLAKRFSSVMSDNVQTTLKVKIVGITQADDFTQLMAYLKHLTPVMDVEPDQVDEGEVTLTISLRGTLDSFTQAILPEKKLTPVSPATYQWNH